MEISSVIALFAAALLIAIPAEAMRRSNSVSSSSERSSPSYHLGSLYASPVGQPSKPAFMPPDDESDDDEGRLFARRRELLRQIDEPCEPTRCAQILAQYLTLPNNEKAKCSDAREARCEGSGLFGKCRCTVTATVTNGCCGYSEGRVTMKACAERSREILNKVRKRNYKFRRQVRGKNGGN